MASDSVKDSELTEAQSLSNEPIPDNDGVPLDEEYLTKLEEFAKNRYTDEDEDYKRIKAKPLSTPPILEGFPPRNSNRGDNRHQNRGHYRPRNERYQRYEETRYDPSSSNSYHRDQRYDEPRYHSSSSNRDYSYERSYYNQ